MKFCDPFLLRIPEGGVEERGTRGDEEEKEGEKKEREGGGRREGDEGTRG